MNHIEKEYKNRFHQEHMSTDDLDIDGLWDAIEQDLDNDSDNTGIMIPMFIGFALFMTGLGILFAGIPSLPTFNQQEISSFDSPRIFVPTDEHCLEETLTPSLYNQPTATTHSPTHTAASTTTATSLQEATTLATNTISTPTPDTNTSSSLLYDNDTPTTIIPNDLSCSPIEIKKGFIDYTREIKLTPSTSTTKPKQQQKTKAIDWSIGLHIAPNSQLFNYESLLSPEFTEAKNNSEHSVIGSSLGFSTSTKIKGNWVASSGVEYHQLYNKFEYKQTSVLQIAEDNQLLKVWINTVTGDTIQKEYGTAIINRTTERHVVHYNETKLFSIPLQIGWQQQKSNWYYGMHIGASLNFVLSQQGRTLNANQVIVDFDNNSALAPLKSFQLGARIQPFVGYHFAQRWSLLLSPTYGYSQRQQYNNSDIIVRQHQFHLSTGIRYNFLR